MTLISSEFGKNLNNICKEMIKEDYNYVSLIFNKDIFNIKKPNDITPKPNNGIYFSKIITEYDDDINEDVTLPEWYKWVIYEDYLVDDYEKSNLLFAKFDFSKIKNLKEFQKTNNTNLGFLDNYNWTDISNKCNGIIVDEYKNLWDIHQIVIWDFETLIEYKYYTKDCILIKSLKK